MVVNRGVMSAPLPPGTGSAKSTAQSFGRGASAAAAAVAASAGSAAGAASSAARQSGGVSGSGAGGGGGGGGGAGRKAGNTSGKKAKKRKQADETRAVVTRPSMSAREDAQLREKRIGRGPSAIDKLSSEEWYGYRLLDSDLGEMRTVYVCGGCNYERNWLRSLEHLLTVKDVTRLILCGITRYAEAARLCKVNASEADLAQSMATTQKAPRSGGAAEKLAKRYAKVARQTPVTVFVPAASAAEAFSEQRAERAEEINAESSARSTDAAMRKAASGAGPAIAASMGTPGRAKKRSKAAPTNARETLAQKMRELDKKARGRHVEYVDI